MIRFRCSECGKKLKADDDIVGRKVRCTRCNTIETVPNSDNLARPYETTHRLATTKPRLKEKPRLENHPKHHDQPVLKDESGPAGNSRRRGKKARFKTEPDFFFNPNTVNLDQPVELFGHSASGQTELENFEPRFNVVRPEINRSRRWLLLGLSGIFLTIAVAVVFNIGWILNLSKILSTDHEQLEEVIFYRNAVSKLEKSRRAMFIAGSAYIAINAGTEQERMDLEDYNASIKSLTSDTAMLEEVESLFRSGKDVPARALLVQSAVELNKLRDEVDLKAREYGDLMKH